VSAVFSLYVEPGSPIHRLHPVAKVLGLLFLFIAAFVADRPLALLPLLVASIGLGIVSGAMGVLWRLRAFFVVVAVVTAATWPFFYDQPLRFSSTGLIYGISMGLKLGTFFTCGIVFLATTRVEELALALRALRVPYRFGFTVTLAVRLVPVFFSAILAVHDAQRCRGLDMRGASPRVRLRQYAGLIVPVFLGALRRADRMAMALETRGFNSGRPRTVYPHAAFGAVDLMALAVPLAVAGIYLWLWAVGATQLPA
jgi:energy-coupling factor transport system permease protein